MPLPVFPHYFQKRLKVPAMHGLKCWELMHYSNQGICIINSRFKKVHNNIKAKQIFTKIGPDLFKQFKNIAVSIIRILSLTNNSFVNHSGILVFPEDFIYYNCFSFKQKAETFIFVVFDEYHIGEVELFSNMEFTPREKEILQAIAQGKTNKQISLVLNIGLETVKSHIRNLFTKAGVRSRAELIARVQIAASSRNNTIDKHKTT